MVVSYIQAVTQILLNLSMGDNKSPSILRFVSGMLANFSEYLALDNQRIRHAAFKSLTLALEYSVKKHFYEAETEESALDGLNFDALNLDDSTKPSLKKFTPQEKVVFHLRYLLTNRF